jgi:tetratricopeptide (TPR) repeat protein
VGYFRHAGLVSLKNFANHEAISLLDEALKLDNALPAPSLDRKTRAEIDLALGEAYLQAIRDKEAIEHFEKGLEGLGYPIPRNLGHLAGAILVSLARRLSLGSARGVCSAVAPADTPALTAVGSTLITLTEIYGGSNKLPQAMYSTLVGTRWAEKLGLPTETARGLAYCSVIFDFLGMKGQAAQLVARAEALLETAPASRNRMLTDLAVGFFHAGRGQLDDAFRDFDRLGRDAATFGDHHRHRDSLNMQIMTLTYAGRFAEALDWSQDLIGSSQRYGDPSMLCVARSEALLSALILGKPEAKVLKSLLERDVTDVPADLHRHQGYVVLGLADVADGHWDDAVARADQVVAFLQARATALVTEYYLSALPAEIYSRAWEQTGDTARFAPKMARALMTLDRYATSYPLGRPVLRWAQGRASALAGRPQRAVGFWRRGLAEAEGKDLAWAEGRLALALAGSPRLPVPQRRVYAQRAWALFERRGIGPALLECNSLLGGLKE